MTETPAGYIRRLIDSSLDMLLAELPAILIVGPRAVGKTTTAERRVRTVVRLNVEAEASAFRADPDAALRRVDEPALFDEWQDAPEVLGAIRRSVDVDPRPGRFLLTGSVRAELSTETWPATGRVTRLRMLPMTMRELAGRADRAGFLEALAEGKEPALPPNVPDLVGYVDHALGGGFPQLALRLSASRVAWLEGYVDDLLTRDVEALGSPLGRRLDVLRLRRYVEAYALHSAGVVEHQSVFGSAGISRNAAIAYDDLLNRLFVVEELPAWQTNRLKRLVAAPKRYLVEPALIGSVLRVDTAGVLRDGDLLGRLLDTFVTAQLRAETSVSPLRPRLHHLRDEGGRHEIDLIVELGGGRVIAIEVKATAAPGADDARHLAWLRDRLGERFVAGVVLHTGPRPFALGERISALPIAALWG